MRAAAARRVVVSGVGVVAPGALGAAAFWASLHAVPQDEVVRRAPDVDLSPWLHPRDARRLDRFAQLAVAAAAEALADAGLDPSGTLADAGLDPYRVATAIGTGLGGTAAYEEGVRAHDERGARRVPVLMVPRYMPNAASAAVSMRWAARGPSEVLVTACAAGTHSVAHAARLVASGQADVALAGGAEASLTGTVLAGFENLGALSRTGRSRPFDAARDGFCAAEGAGVLVLETLESARARGAVAYVEVLGAAATADAHHLTAPPPDGAGAVACLRAALADADLAPSEVAHVNAHGTSTPLNDVAETTALAAVLGEDGPPITSVKGVTGHSLGAAGALEAVAVALSVRHRSLPPTAGLVDVDPEVRGDVVTAARPWEPGPVLSNSFGFGGHNGTLVLAPA